MSTSDYIDPNDETVVSETLSREMVRPATLFCGKELWPFTKGSKSLYQMATSPGDTLIYRTLAFVYIHIRRTEKAMAEDIAKHVAPLVWENLNLFRFLALSMANDLTDEQIEEAVAITQKEFHIESLTEIAATPPELPAGAAQKKSTATSRRKTHGKRSRRPKK